MLGGFYPPHDPGEAAVDWRWRRYFSMCAPGADDAVKDELAHSIAVLASWSG
jgi:hypothetical protein